MIGHRGGDFSGLAALAMVDRRSEVPVAATVFAMLVVIAALFTAAPRSLERADADSLKQAIADAPAAQLRLTVRAVENAPSGVDENPLELPRAFLDEAARVVPEEVDQVFDDPRIVVDTNRFAVTSINGIAPASPTAVTFRVHPDLDAHSSIVEGRAAAPTDEMIDDRPVFEFEISTATAEVLDLALGDLVDLDADTTDATTRRYEGGLPDPFVGRIAGIRELSDASEPYWFGDARLHRPLVADTGLGASLTMYGSIPASLLPVRPFLVEQRSPFTIEQRRDLDPDAVDVASFPGLLDGLDTLAASSVAVASPGRPAVSVALRRVLGVEANQQATAHSVLVLAGTGVLVVALVALAQSLQIAFARRREWLAVARTRGASPQQIVAAAAVEVAVLAAVAIVLGNGVGRLAFGATSTATETRLLGALFVGSVVTALVLAFAEVRRPVGAQPRSGGPRRFGTSGRVASALVVAIGVGSFITFLRRGSGGAAAGEDIGAGGVGGVDTFAVLVPVLVPLAVVALTRRAIPYVLGLVAAIGLALGPGRLVGLRRATADPDASMGLVAVLALALTVGGLGLGVNRSLSAGITDASWDEVGAPLRIDTRDPRIVGSIAAIEGIELAQVADTQFRLQRNGDTFNARLVAVESERLGNLVAGTVADPEIPDELLERGADGAVPVIAAERIGGQLVRTGDVLSGSGSSAAVVFVVAEVRAEAFGRERDWIVADRAVVEGALTRPLPPSSLLFDVPSAELAAVRTIAATENLDVAERAALESRQRGDPLVRAVRVGYFAAGVAVVVLALIAVAGLGLVTARHRRREVAILGLLGAEGSETTRAVRWELLAPVIGGVVIGTILGWFVTRSFDGRFDLSSFASGVPVAIAPDLGAQLIVALIVAGCALVVVTVLSVRIIGSRSHDVLRLEGAT